MLCLDTLKTAADRFLESVFPTDIYCMCCGSIIDGSRTYALCDDCIEKFHWVTDNTCEKCGKILEDSYIHPLCNDCRMREKAFDKGYTCAQYGLYERALMMDLKYRDKSYIGPRVGEILADRIEMELRGREQREVTSQTRFDAGRFSESDIKNNSVDSIAPVDYVIPVPLSEQRMEERGYNQAELLARPVAERLGVPLVKDGLLRVTATEAMKDLGIGERFRNAEGAFAVASHFTERQNILVIDDIYTTGATLDACARVLKEAGAGKVYVLTFAAGGNIPVPAAREYIREEESST